MAPGAVTALSLASVGPSTKREQLKRTGLYTLADLRVLSRMERERERGTGRPENTGVGRGMGRAGNWGWTLGKAAFPLRGPPTHQGHGLPEPPTLSSPKHLARA